MKNILKIFLLLGVILWVSPAADAQVSIGIHVRIAPPALPVYEQPECPVDGWLWQPGYWAYDPADGYYWVPGVWVAPPEPGLLWTPCYWGFDDGVYVFHRGYWGPHVGFYGGINYGFGYPGYGFYGGMWSGHVFRYNTAVFRVNRTVVRNVYINRVTVRPTASRASFNGRGGIMARPRPEDRRAMAEHHFQPTHTQITHQQNAGRNPAQRFSANHGRPSTPVMSRPGNHAVSSPMNRPGVNHGNPGQNYNRGGFNRNVPQRDRSNPAHMRQERAQRMAPQRQPSQQNRPAQQHRFQPQRMEHRDMPGPQHMQQPRQMPRQEHMMQPQRMPQPQHMGGGFGGGQPRQGGGFGGGGGMPHGGGGHFGDGGGHAGGHRP